MAIQDLTAQLWARRIMDCKTRGSQRCPLHTPPSANQRSKLTKCVLFLFMFCSDFHHHCPPLWGFLPFGGLLQYFGWSWRLQAVLYHFCVFPGTTSRHSLALIDLTLAGCGFTPTYYMCTQSLWSWPRSKEPPLNKPTRFTTHKIITLISHYHNK